VILLSKSQQKTLVLLLKLYYGRRHIKKTLHISQNHNCRLFLKPCFIQKHVYIEIQEKVVRVIWYREELYEVLSEAWTPKAHWELGWSLFWCTWYDGWYYDLGNVYAPCIHMRMHGVGRPGGVAQSRRIVKSVGGEYTWHDGSGGDEGEWGSKGIDSMISGFFRQQTETHFHKRVSIPTTHTTHSRSKQKVEGKWYLNYYIFTIFFIKWFWNIKSEKNRKIKNYLKNNTKNCKKKLLKCNNEKNHFSKWKLTISHQSKSCEMKNLQHKSFINCASWCLGIEAVNELQTFFNSDVIRFLTWRIIFLTLHIVKYNELVSLYLIMISLISLF